nr:NotI family restriction endonuclease [uncultured Psychrobacter sp.]
MAVSVAEYLGQRTDIDTVNITPVKLRQAVPCPFMDGKCSKVSKGLQPVCSVRKRNGTMWIVCEHRLCATPKTKEIINSKKREPSLLTEHQTDILWKIASTVYRGDFEKKNIVVNREAPIPIEETGGSYKADYIMRNLAPAAKIDEILLEMQGGGETSSTKSISDHVANWAVLEEPTNEFLRQQLAKPNSIETNAWRRQQEQFLVKGNIVNQTGGKIVFAIGELIYDYLYPRVSRANLRDLRKHNWTLCLLGIKEDKTSPPISGPIPLVVDKERLLFTNYSTFVRTLTDQGGPEPSIFEGNFISLEGKNIKI